MRKTDVPRREPPKACCPNCLHDYNPSLTGEKNESGKNQTCNGSEPAPTRKEKRLLKAITRPFKSLMHAKDQKIQLVNMSSNEFLLTKKQRDI